MSSESENEIVVANPLAFLNEREAHAYRVWQGISKPALAPSLNAQLFNLFLQGKTCEEIRRLNQALQLGEIVAARIQGKWDERREEHLDRLLKAATERAQQTTLETADFVCDILAAANREHGDRLRRYLQNGDEAELGDLRITSLHSLKQTVEILQKLTGQDKQTKVTVAGEILHSASEKKQTTPEQASKILKLLIAK